MKINKRFVYNNSLDIRCPICGEIEDNLHFILQCEGYKPVRGKYIARYLQVNYPADVLFKRLFSNEITSVTRDVAMYIFYALKHREECTNE